MTQWDNMLKDIRNEYDSHPNDFLRQRMISRTIHPNQGTLANKYHGYLMDDLWVNSAVLPFIEDSKVGSPFMLCNNATMSLTTIQNAYYLHQMKKHYNKIVTNNVTKVTDIGGGYGNMCRVFMKLGFVGEYNIIDFPLMHTIQKRFLSENKIENVKYSSLDDEGLSGGENSLLIATFSMNEMPMEDREVIERNIRNYDYIFIAHNRNFDGIDNIEYFKNLNTRLSDTFKITQFECTVNGTHRYFIGHK